MEYLVIYDSAGCIISQMSGDVREPAGIPFMWVEIPDGKRLISIDTSEEIHMPIFEDISKSGTELLKEQLTYTELALTEVYELLLEVMM